jgi:glycosyltransferase involved in cell wall biosynthesis
MAQEQPVKTPPTILYLVAEDAYFWMHRLPLARAVRDAGGNVIVATAPGTLRQRIEAEGFSYYPLRLRRKERRPWQEILSILDIALLYRRVTPDLVHHVTIKPILYGSIAAKLLGVPAIVNAITGLGYIFTSNHEGKKKGLLRRGIETAYKVSLHGNHVKTIFENPDDLALFVKERILQPRQAVVIRSSGVDTEWFHPTPEPSGEVVILLAARMLWDKGIGETVEAGRILKQRQIPHQIVLAGNPDPGNPSCIPESQLRQWHEEGIITWIGQRDDMPAVLAQSHIVCLPSYREGVPVSLLEAASCSRPCVTTDAPGCREIVLDGWNGFQVPLKNPVALADALQKLILDPELRLIMGQRGRELVLEHFRKEIVVEQTFALYQKLLGEKWTL